MFIYRPNGNSLPEFRGALLSGRSGVRKYEIRYVGDTLAGICDFDELKYQKRKEVRRGTRAGSIGIYCAQEAIADSGLDWANLDCERVGVYIGVTEHGNVETENAGLHVAIRGVSVVAQLDDGRCRGARDAYEVLVVGLRQRIDAVRVARDRERLLLL